MRLGIALAAALAIVLAACDGEEEEGVPGSIGDMSASDILERVVAAADSIESVQVEITRTDTQYEAPFPDPDTGKPQTSHELSIFTRDGNYSRYVTEFAPPEDICAEDPTYCEGIGAPFDESLWYRGTFYVRAQPGGEWIDPTKCQADPTACGDHWFGYTSGGSEIAVLSTRSENDAVDCEALLATPDSDATMDPALLEEINLGAIGIYSVDLDRLTDVELVGEEMIAGVTTLHLKGRSSMDLGGSFMPPEIGDLYEECDVPVPTLPPEFGMFEDYMPDRLEADHDLWIDDDFHIIRLQSTTRGLRGNRPLSTGEIEATYSLFDEANLPGPLPQ